MIGVPVQMQAFSPKAAGFTQLSADEAACRAIAQFDGLLRETSNRKMP
jgi:hypothetical protein